MQHRPLAALLVPIFVCGCAAHRPSSTPPSSDSDLARQLASARAEVIEFSGMRIEQMDFGEATLGPNVFRAVVTNSTASPVSVALDLRTTPGLWAATEWQRAIELTIAPRERRPVEATYTFRRLTPEAALRVTLGPPVHGENGSVRIDNPFFRKWYPLGRGNPRAVDLRTFFVHRETPHLDIYAYRGSAAERHVDEIVRERDSAVAAIADLVAVEFHDRIRLVFYPDSATKTTQTGHIGMGWASDNTIVEIYTDTAHLDPFHEVAHIVAGHAGHPPAMFDEGFATYVSERLGSDALAYLGNRGKRLKVVACALSRDKQLIPLDSLLHIDDIGPAESNPAVSYPESAAIVKYLVEVRGLEQFRTAYRTLVSSTESGQWKENAVALRRIYGADPQDIERAWLTWLACDESHNGGT